jgi:glycerophosphoryl diester phosphodiesterase
MRLSRLTTLLLLISALSAGALASASLAGGDDRDPDRAGKASSRHDERPLVIAHRGASGYRPEHTLGAYALGARMGADYIEPDLVITKDGVLVARHEPEISMTTDVEDHPEFAGRRTTKTIEPGLTLTGWFTEDFTLAELKTLRAEERIPATRQENTIYNGRYQVPTLQEVIDLARRLSRELDREIGIYPETKHPTYFQEIGLPLERPLVATLRRNDLDDRRDKVFVQSFETRNLRELEDRIDSPLVQLFGAPNATIVGDGRTYAELAACARSRATPTAWARRRTT